MKIVRLNNKDNEKILPDFITQDKNSKSIVEVMSAKAMSEKIEENTTTGGAETETNMIIDNKHVYLRRVNLGILPNATTKEIAISLGNVTLIKMEGVAIRHADNYVLPLPHANTANVANQVSIRYNGSTKKIELITNSDMSLYTGYINLYYVK